MNTPRPRNPPDVEDARVRAEVPLPRQAGEAAAGEPADAPPPSAAPAAPRRATAALMRSHPAHLLSLGFGSGLSPVAPGTVGTAWGWLAFHVLDHALTPAGWAVALVVCALVGWWACTRTAQALGTGDPGAVVWDEVVAFWLVLWVVTPAPWWVEGLAFALFRAFDATKPGPVAWADRAFKPRAGRPIGWRQGFGIMLDDLVAAWCTLVTMALLWWLARGLGWA